MCKKKSRLLTAPELLRPSRGSPRGRRDVLLTAHNVKQRHRLQQQLKKAIMSGKQQEPRSNNNGGAAAGGDEAATTSGVWSMSREVYWSQVQLCMTAFFALLCFVPFFRPSPYAYKGDDYYIVSPAFNNNTFTVSSFLAPLMVAILPFCDMVLDQVPASLFFLQEQELPRVIQKKEMVRLTDVERSMFILGIVFVSTAAYPPVQQSSNEAALYYGTFFYSFYLFSHGVNAHHVIPPVGSV